MRWHFILKSGVPIDVVSDLIGHNSLEVTRLYAIVEEDNLENGMDKFEGYLDKMGCESQNMTYT